MIIICFCDRMSKIEIVICRVNEVCMDLSIRPVNKNLKEYNKIKKLMLTSFPKNERYPMWLLELLSKRKCIDFSAFYDEEKFCGLTYSISSDKMTFLLYLAVNAEVRSKGYGSEILSCLKKSVPENIVVFNVEKPNTNADNNEQRIKRVNFYLKNGFQTTNYELVDGNDIYSVLASDKNFSLEDYKNIMKKLSFGTYTGKIRQVEEIER